MTTKILSLLTATVVLTVSIGAQAQYPGQGGRGGGRGGYRPPPPPPQHRSFDSTCVVHGTKSNGRGYPSTSAEYEAVGRTDRQACDRALNHCYQDRARNCRITEVNGYAPYNPHNPYDPYDPYEPAYPEDRDPGVGAGIGECETIVLPNGQQVTHCT
jgi:hypothetical protein